MAPPGSTNCIAHRQPRVELFGENQIVHQAENLSYRTFPDPKGDGTRVGMKRNFQILSPLDFMAMFAAYSAERL